MANDTAGRLQSTRCPSPCNVACIEIEAHNIAWPTTQLDDFHRLDAKVQAMFYAQVQAQAQAQALNTKKKIKKKKT